MQGANREENSDSITTGQLLLEFFEFYGYTFENEKYAIDIRHAETPYRQRHELISEAKQELASQREGNSSLDLDTLFSKHEAQMYLMADPFNRSYNPAKVYAQSEIAG